DGAVVMQLERLVADFGQDRRDQRARPLRGEQPARILDVERVDVPARRHRTGGGGIVRVVVDRADRIDQRSNHLLAAAALDQPRNVDVRGRIVHRIGQRETADAIARQRAERQFHELRRSRLPSDEAEAGGEELQRGVPADLRHRPDPLPRVLLLVAYGHPHVGRGGEVDGPITGALHHRGNGKGVSGRDSECAPQTLVAVAKRGFDDLDVRHRQSRSLTRTSGWPSSTAFPFSARIAATVPRAPARIGFISFITSMIPITVSSSTTSPTCTNGGSPGRGAAWALPSSGAGTSTSPARAAPGSCPGGGGGVSSLSLARPALASSRGRSSSSRGDHPPPSRRMRSLKSPTSRSSEEKWLSSSSLAIS